MKNVLKQRKQKLETLRKLRNKNYSYEIKEVENPLFTTCSACKKNFPISEKEENLFICPLCDEHLYVSAFDRVKMLLDEGYHEISTAECIDNPLDFEGYSEKKAFLRKEKNMSDAVLTYHGSIDGYELVLCVMDGAFLMGSMGSELGEKITTAFEYAAENRLPIIIFTASGGARMQEGMFSLMQMAKTSAAAKKHSEAGLLYISYLTNPTTGGVTASFASLADIILAEPNALIAFAGPRVIEQTMKKTLPEGFQRAEFLLEKGFVDRIVHRKKMKKTLSFLLRIHGGRTYFDK